MQLASAIKLTMMDGFSFKEAPCLDVYWDTSSLLSSSRTHISDTLLNILERWSVHCTDSVSICNNLYLQMPGQNEDGGLLSYLGWSCPILACLSWLSSKASTRTCRWFNYFYRPAQKFFNRDLPYHVRKCESSSILIVFH